MLIFQRAPTKRKKPPTPLVPPLHPNTQKKNLWKVPSSEQTIRRSLSGYYKRCVMVKLSFLIVKAQGNCIELAQQLLAAIFIRDFNSLLKVLFTAYYFQPKKSNIVLFLVQTNFWFLNIPTYRVLTSRIHMSERFGL